MPPWRRELCPRDWFYVTALATETPHTRQIVLQNDSASIEEERLWEWVGGRARKTTTKDAQLEYLVPSDRQESNRNGRGGQSQMAPRIRKAFAKNAEEFRR